MKDEELDELEATLDELTLQNDVLMQENELLESFLQRNGQLATDMEDEEKQSDRDKKISVGGLRLRRVRQQVMLTVEQKNEISNAELEATQKELEETKRSAERLIDTLRAVLEETDIRIAELKKDAYEFKRDIVVGAENFHSGKTIAEKIIRYMEGKLQQKDAIIEKLCLKNTTLKSQMQKINAQLRQKEEMGDMLHYIDFHQLQIENKQYVAMIEGRNEELLRLKQTTGHTVQVLNTLRKRLNELIADSSKLKVEILTCSEENEKIVEEMTIVEKKNQKNLRLLQIKQAEEPAKDGLQILDYVAQKAKVYKLQQDVKNHERMVKIMERKVKANRSKRLHE